MKVNLDANKIDKWAANRDISLEVHKELTSPPKTSCLRKKDYENSLFFGSIIGLVIGFILMPIGAGLDSGALVAVGAIIAFIPLLIFLIYLMARESYLLRKIRECFLSCYETLIIVLFIITLLAGLALVWMGFQTHPDGFIPFILGVGLSLGSPFIMQLRYALD